MGAEYAHRFAPVFIQMIEPGSVQGGVVPLEEQFLRLDFAAPGSWEVTKNPRAWIDPKVPWELFRKRDLRPFVYYGWQETASYVILHFAYYHANNNLNLEGHRHDLEGVMILVQKPLAGDEAPKVIGAMAQQHNKFVVRGAKDLVFAQVVDATRAKFKVSLGSGDRVVVTSQSGQQGHGANFLGAATLPSSSVVYIPPAAASTIISPLSGPGVLSTPPCAGLPSSAWQNCAWTYAMASISLRQTIPYPGAEASGLWEQRHSEKLFDEFSVLPSRGQRPAIGLRFRTGTVGSNSLGSAAHPIWHWWGGGAANPAPQLVPRYDSMPRYFLIGHWFFDPIGLWTFGPEGTVCDAPRKTWPAKGLATAPWRAPSSGLCEIQTVAEHSVARQNYTANPFLPACAEEPLSGVTHRYDAWGNSIPRGWIGASGGGGSLLCDAVPLPAQVLPPILLGPKGESLGGVRDTVEDASRGVTTAALLAPPVPCAVPAGITRVVSNGESLWLLARRFYCKGELWPRIAAANTGIKDPRFVPVGTRVVIPRYVPGEQ